MTAWLLLSYIHDSADMICCFLALAFGASWAVLRGQDALQLGLLFVQAVCFSRYSGMLVLRLSDGVTSIYGPVEILAACGREIGTVGISESFRAVTKNCNPFRIPGDISKVRKFGMIPARLYCEKIS